MVAFFRHVLFLVVACSLLGSTLLGTVQAAQSTADVVVDAAVKEKLRKEIVGPDARFPGEQEEYIIGHGDILGISVYGEGNMAASPTSGGENSKSAGGAEVRIDGRVSLLHIGDVHVVGMSLTQLADYLKELYSTVYSDPIVTVVLKESHSRHYTVLGEVEKPGIYSIDYPITVVQALARSGGLTEWADRDIIIVRQGDGLHKNEEGKNTEKKLKFDYDAFLKGKNVEGNIYIQSGDYIIVQQ